MPVRRQGRYGETSRGELNRWIGRESAREPVQIATEETDLSAELREGAFVCAEAGTRSWEDESSIAR
jgi:hypothetical protein